MASHVVASVYRAGAMESIQAVESIHYGHIAVVDADGNLFYSYGDLLKLFQRIR